MTEEQRKLAYELITNLLQAANWPKRKNGEWTSHSCMRTWSSRQLKERSSWNRVHVRCGSCALPASSIEPIR